jgi:SAM-dependent methyltransferase
MGRVSPPLQAYFEQLTDKRLSILIPGCGNSYEAAWLLENGFSSVTLIDISAMLMEKLRDRFRAFTESADPLPTGSSNHPPMAPPLRLITGDFFDLTGSFDLIIEQTFYCALDPALRKDYVEKMYHLLRPGGRLAGVLFDRDFEGGPPFGGHKEEYAALFRQKFILKKIEPCYNSIKPRAGSELFFIAEKPRPSQSVTR